MINGSPSEDELRIRITRQLQWRHESDTTALIWQGYLAGLLEWGAIEIHVYDRLVALLPKKGSKELSELFADEQLTFDEEREIDKFLESQKNI